MSKKVKGIAAYHHAAGDWGAVKAATAAVWGHHDAFENGVKTVTREATCKKVGPEFFQKRSVSPTA